MVVEPTTALWYTHHHDDQLDRCVVVGGHAVCRRCLVLYPITLVLAGVILAGWWLPTWTDLWIVVLGPLPMTVEWVGEHVGGWPYRPRRHLFIATTAGIASGVALGRHLGDAFPPAITAVMVTYAVIFLCSAWWGSRRRPVDEGDWEAEFERAEAERRARLRRMAGVGQSGGATKSINASTAPTSDGSRSL